MQDSATLEIECERSEVESLIQLLFLFSDLKNAIASEHQLEACIAQLSTLSLRQLSESPGKILAEEENLRIETEKLAVANYPIFLANAATSHEVHDEFGMISMSNDSLIEQISQTSGAIHAIFQSADDYANIFRINGKTAQNHTGLLEFLELPQLMETCVHNGYYEDALNILSHTNRMLKKFGNKAPVVKIVASQAQRISGQLFFQLCKQLREPITLPVCLKVVIYLRQLEAFSEQELRLSFLQARGVCLNNQLLTALRKPISPVSVDSLDAQSVVSQGGFAIYQRSEQEAYIRSMRRIEVTRVQLFDSITQYRAVFVDEEHYIKLKIAESDGSLVNSIKNQSFLAETSPLNLDDMHRFVQPNLTGLLPSSAKSSNLFSAWLIRQLAAFLNGITEDLSAILRLPIMTVNEARDNLSFAMSKDLLSGSGCGDDFTSIEVSPETVNSTLNRVHLLLSQSLYFGRSFARIGCDFRANLVKIFSSAILNYFETLLSNALVQFRATLELWPWELDSVDYNFEIPNSSVPLADAAPDPDCLKPPSALLKHPPLIVFCNRILTALNGLCICCPFGLKQKVLVAMVCCLHSAAVGIVATYRVKSEHLPVTLRSRAVHLATAFITEFAPFLLTTCTLGYIFGNSAQWQLHLSPMAGGLAPRLLGEALVREICRPLFDTWPHLAPDAYMNSPDMNCAVSISNDESQSSLPVVSLGYVHSIKTDVISPVCELSFERLDEPGMPSHGRAHETNYIMGLVDQESVKDKVAKTLSDFHINSQIVAEDANVFATSSDKFIFKKLEETTKMLASDETGNMLSTDSITEGDTGNVAASLKVCESFSKVPGLSSQIQNSGVKKDKSFAIENIKDYSSTCESRSLPELVAAPLAIALHVEAIGPMSSDDANCTSQLADESLFSIVADDSLSIAHHLSSVMELSRGTSGGLIPGSSDSDVNKSLNQSGIIITKNESIDSCQNSTVASLPVSSDLSTSLCDSVEVLSIANNCIPEHGWDADNGIWDEDLKSPKKSSSRPQLSIETDSHAEIQTDPECGPPSSNETMDFPTPCNANDFSEDSDAQCEDNEHRT